MREETRITRMAGETRITRILRNVESTIVEVRLAKRMECVRLAGVVARGFRQWEPARRTPHASGDGSEFRTLNVAL